MTTSGWGQPEQPSGAAGAWGYPQGAHHGPSDHKTGSGRRKPGPLIIVAVVLVLAIIAALVVWLLTSGGDDKGGDGTEGEKDKARVTKAAEEYLSVQGCDDANLWLNEYATKKYRENIGAMCDEVDTTAWWWNSGSLESGDFNINSISKSGFHAEGARNLVMGSEGDSNAFLLGAYDVEPYLTNSSRVYSEDYVKDVNVTKEMMEGGLAVDVVDSDGVRRGIIFFVEFEGEYVWGGRFGWILPEQEVKLNSRSLENSQL